MIKQKIAIFDIDGTLFRSGLYREVVFELIKADKIPLAAKADLKPDELNWKIRKNDDSFNIYSDKIVQILERNLNQISVLDYHQAAQKVVDRMGQFCYRYTKELLARLKDQGYYTITISGSPDDVVQIFAKLHNFDLAIGSKYQVTADGFLYGHNLLPTWRDKHLHLKEALDWDRFTLEDSYGIGDTIGDASMLAMVEHPIAFNPEQDLITEAKKQGWPIVVERKNVIYELQPDDRGHHLG